MPVDQKISTRSVFVLANSRLDDWRACEGGNRRATNSRAASIASAVATRDAYPDRRALRAGRWPPSTRGVRCPASHRIHPRDTATSASALHRTASRPRATEKENFLSRWENPRPQQLRKNFGEPRTARKHKLSRRDRVPIGGCISRAPSSRDAAGAPRSGDIRRQFQRTRQHAEPHVAPSARRSRAQEFPRRHLQTQFAGIDGANRSWKACWPRCHAFSSP